MLERFYFEGEKNILTLFGAHFRLDNKEKAGYSTKE